MTLMEKLEERIIERLLGEKDAANDNSTSINNNAWDYENHPMIGKYCVIRTYSAGVHIGILKAVKGNEVILSYARRIFYWNGAFTLSELSQYGVSENSKFSIEVPEIKLTEIEILPCSEEQKEKLRGFKSYEC